MKSNYGKIERDGRNWRIKAEPHVLYRLEQALLNTKRQEDTVLIPATEEAACEIMWFRDLFPLDCIQEQELRTSAAKFQIAQSTANQILSGNYKPRDVRFRKGLKPREYQTMAAELVSQVHGLLVADELGTGKTITAATAIYRPELRPALVVCPAALQTQWRRALHKFIPGLRTHQLRTRAVYDPPEFVNCKKCNRWIERNRQRSRFPTRTKCDQCQLFIESEAVRPDVFITSYSKLDTWQHYLASICKSVTYDEVHELRRGGSDKYKAAHRISRQVKYRIGLSATPIFNYGGEIYNVIDCLRPGALGSKQDFQKTWCLYAGNKTEPALTQADAVGAYLRDNHLMIRRTRKDIGRELPDHSRIVHAVQADIQKLDEIKGDAARLAQLIFNRNRDSMNAAGQLEQLVRQQTGIAKAQYVAEFTRLLLENDTPVILFGWHHAVYSIWESALKDFNPWTIHGKVSNSKKDEARQRFMNGDTNLLIMSLHSGAGIDGLQQRCATGVFGELDWSPARISQCIGRYFRDGQTEPCLTYLLVSEFGLDPAMAQVLAAKREQAEELVGEILEEKSLGQRASAMHIAKLAQQYLDK